MNNKKIKNVIVKEKKSRIYFILEKNLIINTPKSKGLGVK
jgi:hypothetical protein